MAQPASVKLLRNELNQWMNAKTPNGTARIQKQLAALWPHCPLAVVLALVGLLNILDGLSLPLTVLQRIRALNGLAESLSALGGTAQIILGLMLLLAGAGLLWRLVSAWTLSVLLLVITVGVNVAKENWGLSLALQGILLGGLLWAKSYFTRRTILASVVFSLSGILAILAYGVFGSYLLGSGFRPEIHSLNTACYFTIVTLSTVGYGDIVPVTSEARWFVMSLLVIGLGVFASAIASALGPKISGELNRLFNPKEKAMEQKNHVILVGDGAIARNTAEELKQRGVTFIQIVSARAETDPSAQILAGDATNDAVLRQAGIHNARLVIAAREDDGENAFIALGAKELNPDVRVLAVASSPLSIRRLKLARADLVFSPAAVGSRLLADLVEGNQISPAFQDLLEGLPKQV
jgi:voltage-gated potassium channel